MRLGPALAGCLVTLGVAFGPGAASAGPFDVGDTTWEGGTELYQIAKTELGPDRVKPVAVLDWSELRPEDGLLVVHPEQPLDAGEASEFMKLGGRVGVVDDFGRGIDLLQRFRIERVPAPSRPALTLRQNPELAIAEPWIDASRGAVSAPHPIVANVRRLVLNHPTALLHPDLSPVLKIRVLGGDDAIVAVAGQVGEGRLFAMSDPSSVMNSMLRYPGNRAFAAGLVRYLAEDTERGRRGRLFVVSNRFQQEGSVGGEQTLGEDLEDQLRHLAESLADVRRDGLPAWLLALSAAGAVVAMGLWVGRASGRTYKNPLPRYARPTPLVARGGIAGRFAMLAAPTTPRALVLMELKSAAVEVLARQLDLGPQPATEEILRAAQRRGMAPELVAALAETLRQMGRVEAAMVAGSGARVSKETVASAREVVDRAIDALGADGGAASPPPLGDPAS